MTVHRFELRVLLEDYIGPLIYGLLLCYFALHFVKLLWMTLDKGILFPTVFVCNSVVTLRVIFDLIHFISDSVEPFRKWFHTFLLKATHMTDIALILNKSWLLEKGILIYFIVLISSKNWILVKCLCLRSFIIIWLSQRSVVSRWLFIFNLILVQKAHVLFSLLHKDFMSILNRWWVRILIVKGLEVEWVQSLW